MDSAWCNVRLPSGFICLVNHDPGAPLLPPYFATAATPSAPAATDDDAGTLAHAITGDERAWQQLFDRWKKPLLAFFYRSLNSMPEAEDLTLETFVRLHRAGPRYEARAQFATYLFHIARNLLLNELRRRRRKPAQPLPPDAFEYLPSPGAADLQRAAELEEAFQHALGQLPEAQRSLLLLVQQQGLEQPAVAKMLAITENALRVQLHRARERLKQLMTVPS